MTTFSDQHRAFARAVVALAEQHGVKQVYLSFNLSAEPTARLTDVQGDTVSVTWQRGDITVRLKSEISEQIKKDDLLAYLGH